MSNAYRSGHPIKAKWKYSTLGKKCILYVFSIEKIKKYPSLQWDNCIYGSFAVSHSVIYFKLCKLLGKLLRTIVINLRHYQRLIFYVYRKHGTKIKNVLYRYQFTDYNIYDSYYLNDIIMIYLRCLDNYSVLKVIIVRYWKPLATSVWCGNINEHRLWSTGEWTAVAAAAATTAAAVAVTVETVCMCACVCALCVYVFVCVWVVRRARAWKFIQLYVLYGPGNVSVCVRGTKTKTYLSDHNDNNLIRLL